MSQMDNIFLNACRNNQKGVVLTFMKKGGIDVNKRDEMGNTPLYYVCQKGARDIAKILVESGADTTLANNQSVTPLHLAARSGNKDIINLLCQNGADVNATDKEGKTPLVYAIGEGKTEIPRLLLSLGADKSIKDHGGRSAFDYAMERGLRDLLADVFPQKTETDAYGNTPLHHACHNGQSEVVMALIKRGDLDVNALNDDGMTPLLLACRLSNVHIAEILIKSGADVNLKRLDGNSPLHFAADLGNQFIGSALIKGGAGINAKNAEGQTPLIIAAIQGRNDFTGMEENPTFTVSFFDRPKHPSLQICGRVSGKDCDKSKEAGLTPVPYKNTVIFEEAEMVFVCRKVFHTDIEPQNFDDENVLQAYYKGTAPYHRIYVGEVEAVLKRF